MAAMRDAGSNVTDTTVSVRMMSLVRWPVRVITISNEPTRSSRAFSIDALDERGPRVVLPGAQAEIRPGQGGDHRPMRHQGAPEGRHPPPDDQQAIEHPLVGCRAECDIVDPVDLTLDLLGRREVAADDPVEEHGDEGGGVEHPQPRSAAYDTQRVVETGDRPIAHGEHDVAQGGDVDRHRLGRLDAVLQPDGRHDDDLVLAQELGTFGRPRETVGGVDQPEPADGRAQLLVRAQAIDPHELVVADAPGKIRDRRDLLFRLAGPESTDDQGGLRS
jgi:hypothetical protein